MKRKINLPTLILIIPVLLITLIPFGTISSEPENLIVNGDFQDGNLNYPWLPFNPEDGEEWLIDGSYYARLEIDDYPYGTTFWVLGQEIWIDTLDLDFSYGIFLSSNEAGCGTAVYLWILDGNTTLVKLTDYFLSTMTDWEQYGYNVLDRIIDYYEIRDEDPPDLSGADKIKVIVSVMSGSLGNYNCSFDDFYLGPALSSKGDLLKDSGIPGKGLETAPGQEKEFNERSQAVENVGMKE